VLIKLPQIKSEIIDLKGAMQETSQNIEGLNKRIRELELLNKVSAQKEQELQQRVADLSKHSPEDAKRWKEEAAKLRDRLAQAENQKVMIQTKLNQVEKQLVEFKDIVAGQKQTIQSLYEQKKEVVYVDKDVPGKLKEDELAIFEKKCQSLSQMCDTVDLVVRQDATVMTEEVFGQI